MRWAGHAVPKKIRDSFRILLGPLTRRAFLRPRFILNFEEHCTGRPAQKALVSYLVNPLFPPAERRDKVMFSNLGIAQRIPRALNELGYSVDIIQYDLLGWRASAKYDLFVGHGGINFEEISRQLPQDTVRIYFSTSIYWHEFNVREARRLFDLAVRRGYLLAPDRPVMHSEEYANQTADGIIVLGNEKAVETYSRFPLVFGINNAVYPIDWSGLATKDFDSGRTQFLFFSGAGSVHKGLDLLLEAFAGTALDLHICQSIDGAFARVYRHELEECPNIHVHGVVPMRSALFEELVATCNWVISATCAEGQAGATLECMGYGLIPILPDSGNIDLEDFGEPLPDNSIETIRSTVLRAAETPVEECRARSQLVSQAIHDKYSPEHFDYSFRHAVSRIVDSARQRGNQSGS